MERHPADRHFAIFAQTGDATALAQVFDRLAQEMLLVASHLSRRSGEPEDLLHDTFLAAIESAPRWDETRPLLPWLIGIMVNQARHAQRRRAPGDMTRANDLAGREPDPAAAAEGIELAEAIAHALGKLPMPYRHVMTLRWAHGLTATEIAHSLGCPPATIKTKLRRGLAILRQALPTSLAVSAALLITPAAALANVRQLVLAHAAQRLPTSLALAGVDAAASNGAGAGANAAGSGAGVSAGALVLGVLGLGCVLALTALFVWPSSASARGSVLASASPVERTPRGANEPTLDRLRQPLAAVTSTDRGGVVLSVRHHDDAPASRALVGLVPLDRDQPALRERWLRCDAAGELVAELEPGRHAVVAERGGRVEIRVEAGRQTRAVLAVPRGIDVEGDVVDAEGRPVPATIQVSKPGAGDEVVAATETDAAGRFHLRDVEPGRLLSALAPRYGASRPVRVGDASAAVRAGNAKVGSRSAARATADGTTANDVTAGETSTTNGSTTNIGKTNDGKANDGKTNDGKANDGKANDGKTNDGKANDGNSAPAVLADSVNLGNAATDESSAARSQHVRLVLADRGVALSGRVLDDLGVPVAGARLLLGLNFGGSAAAASHVIGAGQPPPLWLTTDGEGRFATASAFAQRLPLCCGALGHAPHYRTIDVADGAQVEIVLQRGAVLAGRVVDDAGAGVGGARVEAVAQRFAGRRVAVVPPWTTGVAVTGADGRFALAGLEPGRTRVRVHFDDGRGAYEVVELEAGATREWRATLAPPAAIAARVVDEAGLPLAGERVLLVQPGERSATRTAIADERGAIVFERCAAGRYELCLVPPSGPFDTVLERAFVQPGDAEVRVVAAASRRATAAIAGRVVDGAGRVLPDAVVHAALGARGSASVACADDGTFRIEPLPPGSYEIAVRRGGVFVARTGGHVVRAAATTAVDLVVREHGTVRLSLTPAARALASSGATRIVDELGIGWHTFSLKGRETESAGLPVGRYVAVIADRNAAHEAVPFEVVANATTDLVLEPGNGLCCPIRITHPFDGKNLMLSWTWCDGAGRLLFVERRAWLRSGPDADEQVVRLRPGSYRLRIESDQGLAAEAAFTMAADADQPLCLDLTPPEPSSVPVEQSR